MTIEFGCSTCWTPHTTLSLIAGTRDRLVHAYFDVDLDQLWQIVSSDLAPLAISLNAALGSKPSI